MAVRALRAPTALPVPAYSSRAPSSCSWPRNSFHIPGPLAPAPAMLFDPSPHSPVLPVCGSRTRPMSWASLIYPSPRDVPCTQGCGCPSAPWMSCSWLGWGDVLRLPDLTLMTWGTPATPSGELLPLLSPGSFSFPHLFFTSLCSISSLGASLLSKNIFVLYLLKQDLWVCLGA